MGKNGVILFVLICAVGLGMIDSALAENPGPDLKLKENAKVLKETMAVLAGISHIEYQTNISDKERWDYYSVFRHQQCLIKFSNEIGIVDLSTGESKGDIYTEDTVNLSDMDKISIADAEKEVVDSKDYFRVGLSCRGSNKCVKDEKAVGNGIPDARTLDTFSFIARKTTSKAELEKVLNRAIGLCSHK
jgi:hypothetical protein